MKQLKPTPVTAAPDTPMAQVRVALDHTKSHMLFLQQLHTNLQLLERSLTQRGVSFSTAPCVSGEQFTYVISSDMALVIDVLTQVFRARFPAAAAAPEMLRVQNQPFGNGVRADIQVQRIDATNHVVLTLSDVHAA